VTRLPVLKVEHNKRQETLKGEIIVQMWWKKH